MTKLQTAAGVAAILLLSNGSAAAQVSKDFIGVWVSTQNNQNNSLKCRKADWAAGNENDGLINIASRKVAYWESGCDIASFRILEPQKDAAEVVLTCGGEGYAWRARQIWSLQTIEARKALIVVQLQKTENGEDGKSPPTIMKNDIVPHLYVGCR